MTDAGGRRRLGRRRLLGAVGAVAVGVLAGCASGADDGSTPTGTGEPTATPDRPTQTGRRDPDARALRERIETTSRERGYEWIAFEKPHEQLSVPADGPTSGLEFGAGYEWLVETTTSREAGAEDVDAVYLLIDPGEGGTATAAGGDRLGLVVVSDRREFDSGEGFAAVYGSGPYGRSGTEQFVRDHVSGYAETSDGFPDGLRDLADGAPQCLC